jgi:hypothetical protein
VAQIARIDIALQVGASSEFGRINTGSTFLAPRNGQLVARFQW